MEHLLKIKIEQPPNLKQIIEAGMKPNNFTIFTYGDTIYNPNNVLISEDLFFHEKKHYEQQKENPKKWWDRYLIDDFFRANQEAEAYAAQYEFFCQKIKDKNQRFKILYNLSLILSSPLYGEIISQSNAFNLIKKNAK